MRKVTRCFLIPCLLCLSSLVVEAQVSKVHPIDQQERRCLQNPESNADRDACVTRATEMWEKEMNKTYDDLYRLLDQRGKRALQQSQAVWKNYSVAQVGIIDSIYGSLQGNWRNFELVVDHRDVVKDRALSLKKLLRLAQQK